MKTVEMMKKELYNSRENNVEKFDELMMQMELGEIEEEEFSRFEEETNYWMYEQGTWIDTRTNEEIKI